MSATTSPVIVVIGSGLAGSSAALSAAATAPPTAHIILLEKEARPGGNSMKASSGINILNPEHNDTQDEFVHDVIGSGGGRSNETLVSTLVSESTAALEHLRSLGVNLDGLVQLGGHKHPRTHHPQGGLPVGAAIMKVIGETLKQSPNVEIITGAKVIELIRDQNNDNRIIGVKYIANTTRANIEEQQTQQEEHIIDTHAVVLATGGFSANKSLLAAHSPAAANLPTTNGPFAQGDGLALGQHIGAATVDLDSVQLHPTSFIDPADRNSTTRFLCPERIRGVGGILVNTQGRRFVNELGRRDDVSDAILAQPEGRAFLVLGQDTAHHVGSALGFYQSRGLIRKAENIEEAASIIGVSSVDALKRDIESYDAIYAAHKQQASGDGKLSDEFGKTVFPAQVGISGPFFIAEVGPAVHYTMGGLKFDSEGRVLNDKGEPIVGLFAAGEVTGGVHGANRLAGNSLLECVVFGRIAGRHAALLATSGNSSGST